MSFKRVNTEDPSQYIFDGVLVKFDKVIYGIDMNAEIDHTSINNCVDQYKQTYIDKNAAFGSITNFLESDEEHEIPFGDLSLIKDGPEFYEAKFDERDLALTDQEKAFQILDLIYDEDRCILFGRIMFLDTQYGRQAKELIDGGSSFSTSDFLIDNTIETEKNNHYMPRILYRANKMLNFWKIFFI